MLDIRPSSQYNYVWCSAELSFLYQTTTSQGTAKLKELYVSKCKCMKAVYIHQWVKNFSRIMYSFCILSDEGFFLFK